MDKWVIHPQFSSRNQDKDISIVFLKTPLKLNEKSIRTVKLIGKNVVIPHKSNVTVTGWGYQKVKYIQTK